MKRTIAVAPSNYAFCIPKMADRFEIHKLCFHSMSFPKDPIVDSNDSNKKKSLTLNEQLKKSALKEHKLQMKILDSNWSPYSPKIFRCPLHSDEAMSLWVANTDNKGMDNYKKEITNHKLLINHLNELCNLPESATKSFKNIMSDGLAGLKDHITSNSPWYKQFKNENSYDQIISLLSLGLTYE